VLDLLQQYPADFVVCADSSLNPGTPWFRRTYYEIEEVQRITPGFSFPGYAFNAGQYVGTSGILRREHFEKYLEFALTIRARHPNALKNADQGVLNVVIPSAASRGDVSLGKADFLVWAWSKPAQAISLSDIERKQGVPSVLHYAGPKPLRLSKSPRYNLLRFFEDRYYEQSGEGKLKRLRHKWARWAEGAKWYSRILANRGLAGSAKGTFTRILKRGVKSSLW